MILRIRATVISSFSLAHRKVTHVESLVVLRSSIGAYFILIVDKLFEELLIRKR